MGQINRYTDFYPLLTPELPGCPEPLILQAIQKKTRQFCQDTDAWREQLADINLVEGVRNYILNSSFTAEILKAQEVRINTEENRALGYQGVILDEDQYEYHVEQTQKAGTTIQAGTLRLAEDQEPADDVAGGLEVNVSLAPLLSATLIDGDFFRLWQEALIGGTLFFLMTILKRKWTDPQRAALYLLDYNKGISRARRANVAGHKGGGGDVKA